MNAEEIHKIDNSSKHEMFLLDGKQESVFQKNYTVLMNMAPFKKHIVLNTPFLSEEHRIMLVTSGYTVHSANMKQYHLHKGDLLILPANIIFTINSFSDDFDAKVLSFNFVSPEIASFIGYNPISLKLDGSNLNIFNSIISLISQMNLMDVKTSGEKNEIEHLVLALLYFIKRLYTEINGGKLPYMSRAEIIKNEFLKILNGSGLPNKSVAFYAEQLNVSVNHLQQCIKKQSGFTVKEWINKKNIQIINHLLLKDNGNLSLKEIALYLEMGDSSQLSRFYKHNTGMTPAEYRKSVVN